MALLRGILLLPVVLLSCTWQCARSSSSGGHARQTVHAVQELMARRGSAVLPMGPPARWIPEAPIRGLCSQLQAPAAPAAPLPLNNTVL